MSLRLLHCALDGCEMMEAFAQSEEDSDGEGPAREQKRRRRFRTAWDTASTAQILQPLDPDSSQVLTIIMLKVERMNVISADEQPVQLEARQSKELEEQTRGI